MADSKPCATLMELQSAKRSNISSDESQYAEVTPYRQAIGSLMYLALGKRPDIVFAVNRLAQYCE